MFIRTTRLFLRPVFAEDWRAILTGMDESVARMLVRAPWPYADSDAIEFCAGAEERGPYSLAITAPCEPGVPLIGLVGLEMGGARAGDGEAELGYWIGARWRGRNYAAEAVKGLLTTAAAHGVGRVFAGHFPDNPASGKVLLRAGFVETGETREAACRGRGGEVLPLRCYAIDLASPVGGPGSGDALAA